MLDVGRADERLIHESLRQARSAELAPIPLGLTNEVRAGIGTGSSGSEALYEHQAEALEAALERPIVITTGTASGKSLCFNLPTLERSVTRRPRARALPLPDQGARPGPGARAERVRPHQAVRPAIYDGDTPREARGGDPQARQRGAHQSRHAARRHPPQPRRLGRLFANLAVVVVDEAHVYRGVFGSHVANVLRAAARIAAAYGTEPRFLLASATIANPVELAERLTGLEDVAPDRRDGAAARAGGSRCGTRR